MITIQIETGKEFRCPEKRSEITYEQWAKAYEHLKKVEEGQDLLEKGNYIDSSKITIRGICGMIAELSEGITEQELLMCDWDKVNKIFASVFSFIQNEPPKNKFEVGGKTLTIPDFNLTTGLQLMDCTAYLQQITESGDHEKGLIIASVYTTEKYTQDLKAFEDRKEWIRKHGRMDLFYSASFFLLNSIKRLKLFTLPHSIQEEVEVLTKDLVGLATIQYLLVSQKT